MYIVITEFTPAYSTESISEAVELCIMRQYNQPSWNSYVLGVNGQRIDDKVIRAFAQTLLDTKMREIAALYDYLHPAALGRGTK